MGVAMFAIWGCSGKTNSHAGSGGGSGAPTGGTGGTSGGSTSVGGADASGQAGESSIDCSQVGCSPPPLCSTGCTEQCGCCPCTEGEVQGELVCTGGCFTELCAPLPSLTPPAATEMCTATNPCDPDLPASGVCYNLPGYTSSPASVEIWIADATGLAGQRATLLPSQPVTVAGHTYQIGVETLIGTGGHGVNGDVAVTVDGQARQIQFHLEGFGTYRGGGVWDWDAAISTSNAGCTGCTSSAGRHYTITRTGPDCPPYNTGSYAFVADDPPRGCGSGVDLVGMVLPGA